MLVVPTFVNWSDHRAIFEREASALVGHPVRVKGDADAQILPIPTFTFTNIEVGEVGGAPLMSAGRLKIRLELIPLFQRKFEVVDMELDAPQLSLRIDESGKTNWFKRAAATTALIEEFSVKLGPVSIRDGAIYAADQTHNNPLQLTDINGTMSAQSLIGPWKLEGQAIQAENLFSFKVSTGKFADNALRLKTALDPDGEDFTAVLDGELIFADLQGKTIFPFYKGALNVTQKPAEEDEDLRSSSNGEEGWNLTGRFEIDREKALLSQVVFEDGAQEAPLSLSGSVNVYYSPSMRFESVISSRQIDLDRSFGDGPSAPLSLENAQSVIADAILALPKPSIPGVLSVDVPGVVVGGDVIRSVHFGATPTQSGWMIEDFGATFPGTTRVRFDGDVSMHNGLSVDGNLRVSSERLISLARWWRPESGDDARRIKVNALELNAYLSAEQNALRLTDMKINLGASDMAGRISLTQVSKRQSQVDANITSRTLNLDAIEALTALFVGKNNLSGFGENDKLSLQLVADKLTSQSFEGSDADINLTIAAGEINVTSLKITDFAGAALDVSGVIRNVVSRPSGRFNGSLKAESMTGLIKIAETLAPEHPAVGYLKQHGEAFLPLDVAVNFSGDRNDTNNDAPPSDIAATIVGIVGGGDVKAGVRFQGDWGEIRNGDVEASVHATFKEANDLLRMAGRATIGDITGGEAIIDITAKGTGSRGITIKNDVSVAKVALTGLSTWMFEEDGTPVYRGDAAVKSENVEPLLSLLGLSLPATGLGSDADLEVGFEGRGYNGKFKTVKGAVAGNMITAALGFEGVEPGNPGLWKWDGTLSTERLSLPWLAALVTGEIITPIDLEISPESVGEAGNVTDEEDKGLGSSFWSHGQYGKSYLARINLDLNVTTDEMELTHLRKFNNAKFSFRLRPYDLGFSDVSAEFASGKISGSLRFLNVDGAVTISGLVDLKDADASSLLWFDGARPVVEGGLSASAQFEGVGRSLAAVVSTLGGDGSITLSNARLRRINPSAFKLIVEAADKDIALDSTTVTPLVEGHLDAGSLTVEKAEATFNLTSGVLRVSNASFDAENLNARAGVSLNLPEMTLKGSMALSVDSEKFDETPVKGSTPEIAILFDGPIDQPKRLVDLQPLLGYLTVRRFEQEVKRVEILQADILEKQRLSRYARWISAETARERREEEQAEILRLERLEREEQERKLQGELEKEQAKKAAEEAKFDIKKLKVTPSTFLEQPLSLRPRAQE